MKIKINKGNFGVPMIIRQSFIFNTRSYGIHKAEVALTRDGEYSMTIDGSSAFSIHDAAAKRSPFYKDAIVKVSNDMQRAMEEYDDAYKTLSRKTPYPKSRATVENQLSKLVLKQYERESFPLPMPRKSEVEADLREEANLKFFSVWSNNTSKKNEFITDTLEEEYSERMSNWEELKQYHDAVQYCVETQINEKYQKEYNERKKIIEDELYGDDAYVSKQLFEANAKLNNQIPFDITLEVNYNKNDGVIDATATLPSLISIPGKKAVQLASGKISVKDKLKRELDTDTANTLFGLSYYLAGHLFNLSVNVSVVRLSVVTGFSAYYWVEFERKSFSALSFSALYPLQDFFSHPNVVDYTKSSIEMIPETEFRQRINEAIKVSDLLSRNSDLIVLSVREAEKISKILDGTDDLKQAVKEAKSNHTSVVVANKRYKNILSEINAN